MTVVVRTRADFTLDNYRRVCYGGESVRLGDQARRAMTAGARTTPAARLPGRETESPVAWPAATGAGFGDGHLDQAVVRGILFARLASLVSPKRLATIACWCRIEPTQEPDGATMTS